MLTAITAIGVPVAHASVTDMSPPTLPPPSAVYSSLPLPIGDGGSIDGERDSSRLTGVAPPNFNPSPSADQTRFAQTQEDWDTIDAVAHDDDIEIDSIDIGIDIDSHAKAAAAFSHETYIDDAFAADSADSNADNNLNSNEMKNGADTEYGTDIEGDNLATPATPKPRLDTGSAAPAVPNLTSDYVPLNAISPETVQTFVEVVDTIRQQYVKPVNDEVLFQYAIAGMLQKLDSHAEYLTPTGYAKLRGFTDGEIAQVGLSADYDSTQQAWVIDTVVPKSSAQQAGIEVGEKLLYIKTVPLLADMSRQDIEQLLSGIAGSHVQVEVANSKGVTRTVVMERNLPKNNQLEVVIQNSVAIVRLPIFQNSTKSQLIKALRQIKQPILGIVLDVSNNPGGVLSAAIDVASLFIVDKGLIQVKNRTNSSQIIRPNGVPYLANVPVVVLQNRYSASASEVLASSLQSNQRALIVGEKSFGKGTVQEVIPLQTGGAVKLTVAEYRSASGTIIDGVGITPDVTFVHDGANWQQRAFTVLLANTAAAPTVLDFGQSDVIGDY